ncbi:hypothetical protein H4R19_000044 [Coemansia spiralis]|nr:hypothetical protein H4R19_000044 [Coemansia spiralis]
MIRHRVRPTDTLEGISVQYGASVSQLKRLNRLWQATEMAARGCIYIPLRLCSSRFSLANIEYLNACHAAEARGGRMPATPHIDLIEVILDPSDCPDVEQQPASGARKHALPLVAYESIQHVFLFAL